jgi:transcriptional regulator of NAD metabolism
MDPGAIIFEEDSQNYIVEKPDDNNLYNLIEYEESEPLPEDEDGVHLHLQDDYYEEDNNYYSG